MAGSTEAFTAAGTIISISAALPASVTASAYDALTYTEIGEVTDGGSIGRTYNMVNHLPLGKRGLVKIKGSFDDGTLTIQAAFAPGDAGQALVETALDDDAFYSIKIELQDGTKIFSQAQVTSAPVAIGTADTVVGTTFALAIKSGSIKRKLPA
jgi:hypothetical protein